MPSQGNSESRNQMPKAFNRRKFLGAVASVGIVGTAGCNESQDTPSGGDGIADDDTPADDDGSSGDGSDGDTSTSNSNGSAMDEEFTSYMNIPPSDTQYNPNRPQNFGGNVDAITNDMLAKYDFYSQDRNWIPLVASDWNLPDTMEEDAVVTLNISETHTWHDGEPVTAQDVKTQFTIDKAIGGSVWDFTKEISVADEKTLEFTLANAVNKPIYRRELLDRRVNQPYSRFGEYADRLEDATSQSETDSVLEELTQYAPEEPLGNGPFKHEAVEDQKYILSKYEDYENQYITADDINFSRYGLRLSPGGEAVPQYIINKEIDGTPQTDPQPEQLEQFPEGYTTTHPAFVGEGLILNVGHSGQGYEATEYFDNRNVRKAIGHVFARDQARRSMPGPSDLYGSIPVPTGIMPNKSEELIDSLDSFERYAFETPDYERATELLEGEGFSQEGGKWYTPSGDRWTLSVKSHTAATWLTVAQVGAALLDDFGINVEQTQEEDSTYFGSTIPNGDFDLCACNWGGGGANLPYANFRALMSRRSGDKYPIPTEVEVPMPVGNPDGSLETIEFDPLIKELGTTSDQARRKELVSKIAWGYNQSAFHFPVRVWEAIAFVSTDEWEFPDPEEDADMHLNRPAYWPVRRGKHKAKTE